MTNTEVDTNQNTQNNESCRCTENEGTSPSHVGGEKPSKHAVGETQNPYRNPSCYAVVERTKRYVNTIAGKNNENVALLKKIVRDSNSLIGYLKKVQVSKTSLFGYENNDSIDQSTAITGGRRLRWGMNP